MDFQDDPAEAAFRAEVRAWLDTVAEPKDAADAGLHLRAKTHDEDVAHLAEARVWQKTMVDAGYAAVHWPVEHGGRGLSGAMAVIASQERARYQVPQNPFMVGIDMAGPTLMAHGTPEQQARWLRGTLTGEFHWCQLFSEPDAGSDLASLTTRAVRDGDEWVVTGQKVWTSQAHVADLGMLLARTDPDAPKHQGISYFVVDMHSPGIEIRPLRQIDGGVHFNEVFLDELRLPADALIGEVNAGWTVARTTLTSERTAIGTGGGGVNVEEIIELARSTGALADPLIRQEIAKLHTRRELQRWLGYRTRTAVSQGRAPGPEASVLKLLNNQQVAHGGDIVLAVQGAAGTLWHESAAADGFWQDMFLFQWSSRIGGGTEQIQRNIVAERVLGLPREPSPT